MGFANRCAAKRTHFEASRDAAADATGPEKVIELAWDLPQEALR